MRTRNSNLRSQRGLTLTELAVAMAVAGIFLAAAYAIFLTQQKTYAVQDQVAEVQQNARVAMNMLARDLRMAGHGVPTLWTVTIGGTVYRDVVTVDPDGGGLTLLGCFGAPEGYLARAPLSGDTQIDLVDASHFSKEAPDDRKYIFIGEYDKAVITDIGGNTLTLNQGLRKRYPTTRLTADANPGDKQISVHSTTNIQAGDILTLGDERLYVTGLAGTTINFDTDPINPGDDPLQGDYEKDERVNPLPVYRVQALRYDLQPDGRITREDLAVGQKVTLAENIESLTIIPQVPNNPTYQIVLTAKTGVPDDAGRLRKRSYSFTIRCRNRL